MQEPKTVVCDGKTEERKAESEVNAAGSVTPVAPDGGWGWLVVFGSFMIHVVVDGLIYSFGLFFVEFLDDFNTTKGETSVVASMIVGISYLIGPLSSVLVNRYQCRVTAFVGSITATIGYIISFWAPNLYFLYFSFGILAGVGSGLLIHPAVVVVAQYFDKKRSLTTGIAVCGSGFGMFAFPPLIQALVNAYAWQGASLILGGLMLNLCVCGALYRPLKGDRLVLYEEAQETLLDDEESSPKSLRIRQSSMMMGSVSDVYALSHTQIPQHTDPGISAFLKDLKEEIKTTMNMKLLKDIPFLIFAFSGTLTCIGFNAPYIFIPHHAELNGISEQDASFLISIIGITNIFGRVIFGFLGDRVRAQRLFAFATATVIVGVSTALIPLCTNYALLATYAAVFGFTVGGVVALNWVLLPDLLGVENYASSLGLCMMFDGMTTPIGPPFLGWVFDITGTYDTSFIVGGIMIIISGLILYPIPCIRAKKWTYVIASLEDEKPKR